MKINYRQLMLVLCGALLFMLAGNFLKIDSRVTSLAAAAVIVLLTLRTDFLSGFFMAVLFSFAYYSLHPDEKVAGLFINTLFFTALAFLAARLVPEKKHEKNSTSQDESEKEFVRRVTGALMLAHEMTVEINKGVTHDELLRLMARNIFSLLKAKQVMVYTAAAGEKYTLLLSEGAFDKSAVMRETEFKNMERIAVKNISSGVLKLIEGAGDGFYVLVPSGREKERQDAVVLFGSREFDSSEIYIAEFFIAQVYSVIDKHRHSDVLRDNYEKVIETLSLAIDAKEQEKSRHSLDTMHYAARMADRLGLPEEEMEKIKYAALLHDIGKINISASILNKPGALTREEYEIIKQHPEEGADILKKLDIFSGIMPIIMHHHEHMDGRGYPKKLKGEEIPLGSRVCAIADAYSVMISDRPYRKAMSRAAALEELKKCSGTQFDAELVGVFAEIIKNDEESLPARPAGKGK